MEQKLLKLSFALLIIAVIARFVMVDYIFNDSLAPLAVVGVYVLALTAFSLIHGKQTLGLKNILAFFAIAAIVSFSLEFVGVTTGLVYGEYLFSELLGPKILGIVPWVIPIAWFMMIYASFTITNHIIPRVNAVIPLAFFDSVVMTTWDLMLDPVSAKLGYWTWITPGTFFGVGFHNFLGWLATTFIIFYLFRKFFTSKRVKSSSFTKLPIAVYALEMVALALITIALGMPLLGLIGFLGMGSFIFIALKRDMILRK